MHTDTAIVFGWSSLTPAERRVVDGVAEGFTNRSIAALLGLSTYTVESHLKHIFTKLGVTSRVAVATEAIRQSVVQR